VEWVWVGLCALSPAILYGLALVVAGLVTTFYRRRCPACGERGLKSKNFICATVVIDGQRAPDSWEYFACERCRAGFKLHRKEWSRVEGPEYEEYCTDGTANPTTP